VFLVRATPHAYASTPGRRAEADLGPPLAPGEGEFEARIHELRDLETAPALHAPPPVYLLPSSFTPPEPPELFEPWPLFPPEDLLDLLRRTAEEDTWDDPARLEVGNAFLRVRQRPSVQEGIARWLEALRDGALWTLAVEARVVDLPEALARDLGAGGPLDSAAAGRLEQALARGEASVAAGLRLLCPAGRQHSVSAGERVSYLFDFEPYIAESAAIGDPVFQDVLSGAALTVDAARSVDGGAVGMEVEFTLSHVKSPIRVALTEHGGIELPEMDLLRVRTGLVVPLDRPAVAASWAADGRRRILVLVPRIR
jgi:hypothetical protein